MLIAGAKGFAKELLVSWNDVQDVEWVFFDDVSNNLPEKLFNQFTIITSIEEAKLYFKKDNRFILGTGSPSSRKLLTEKLINAGGELTEFISPKAIIGRFGNNFQKGVTIQPMAIIETENIIGEGTLIHAGALISHNCNIGNYCEVSPAAQILGGVTIGNECSIGAGAIILPRISIGNNVTIGAGAVVTKNTGDNGTWIGVPARKMI